MEPARSRGRLPSPAAAATALAVAAAAGGGVLVASGDEGWRPFALWLASLALAWIVTPRGGRRTEFTTVDAALLAALAGLALAFRVVQLDDIPYGLWSDERSCAANALGMAGRPFLPFGATPLYAIGPDWVRTPNLYLYACRAVLWAFGAGHLGIKMISVLPGVATVPLAYLLARRFLSRGAAAVAAGLLAVSLWQVTLSRWGWDEVLVTALAVAVFACIAWEDPAGANRWMLAGGVLAGLALYAYIAARLLVLAAALFLALRWLLARDRRALRAGAVFAAGLALAVVPLAAHWLRDPAEFAARLRDFSGPDAALGGGLRGVLGNAAAYAGMLFLAGDRNPRHNLPGLPMLDAVAGALAAVGLAVSAARWKRVPSQMTLIWLGVGLLGGVLSATSDAPNAYRTGFVAPACYLLSGVGFQTLASLAERRGRVSPRLAAVLAAALVATSGVVSALAYFGGRPASKACWSSTAEGASAEFARRCIGEAAHGGGRVLLDRAMRTDALAFEIDGLLCRGRPDCPVRWAELPAVPPESLRGTLVLTTPSAWDALPPRLRGLPARGLEGPFSDPLLVAVSADERLLRALRPPR